MIEFNIKSSLGASWRQAPVHLCETPSPFPRRHLSRFYLRAWVNSRDRRHVFPAFDARRHCVLNASLRLSPRESAAVGGAFELT